jgi:hypothetical protein
VFRSEDRGEHWRTMSDLDSRPMYYSQIRIGYCRRLAWIRHSFGVEWSPQARTLKVTSYTDVYPNIPASIQCL